MGVSKRLKEFDSSIQVTLMQPDSPFHGLEGMKHMESTITPKIFDRSVADLHITVKTEDAYKTARRLAAEEGVFVGISSGANVYAAMETAKNLPAGSRVATILCDNGTRYLSQPLWRDLT
jgi:cysteine synthase B